MTNCVSVFPLPSKIHKSLNSWILLKTVSTFCTGLNTRLSMIVSSCFNHPGDNRPYDCLRKSNICKILSVIVSVMGLRRAWRYSPSIVSTIFFLNLKKSDLFYNFSKFSTFADIFVNKTIFRICSTNSKKIHSKEA